eukprot:3651263-Rhodomonas_salina.1
MSLRLRAVGPITWRGQAFGLAHLHLYGVLRACTAPSGAGGGPVEPLPGRAMRAASRCAARSEHSTRRG